MLCEMEKKKSYLGRTSDAWCDIRQTGEFVLFTLVLFSTNIIFMGWFEVGAVDFMLLMKHLTMLVVILKKLLSQKVNLPWFKASLQALKM